MISYRKEFPIPAKIEAVVGCDELFRLYKTLAY